MPRKKKTTEEKTETKAKGPTKSRKKLVEGDTVFPTYSPSAARNAYRVGDIVKFPVVRNWSANGELVEAYGKIVGLGVFDKTIPYIEVSFSDVKKLNKFDLGTDVRKFLLEQKE